MATSRAEAAIRSRQPALSATAYLAVREALSPSPAARPLNWRGRLRDTEYVAQAWVPFLREIDVVNPDSQGHRYAIRPGPPKSKSPKLVTVPQKLLCGAKSTANLGRRLRAGRGSCQRLSRPGARKRQSDRALGRRKIRHRNRRHHALEAAIVAPPLGWPRIPQQDQTVEDRLPGRVHRIHLLTVNRIAAPGKYAHAPCPG